MSEPDFLNKTYSSYPSSRADEVLGEQVFWEPLGSQHSLRSLLSATGKLQHLFPASFQSATEISASQNRMKNKAVCFSFLRTPSLILGSPQQSCGVSYE